MHIRPSFQMSAVNQTYRSTQLTRPHGVNAPSSVRPAEGAASISVSNNVGAPGGPGAIALPVNGDDLPEDWRAKMLQFIADMKQDGPPLDGRMRQLIVQFEQGVARQPSSRGQMIDLEG